jgi:hypothetical protein
VAKFEIDLRRGTGILSARNWRGGTMATGEQQGQPAGSLDAARLLRAQVQEVHRELDARLTAWLLGLAPANPPTGSRVIALYVHAATSEHVTINSLHRGLAPLYAWVWAGAGPAHYSTADLTPLFSYARQVFAATDGYLADLTSDEAMRKVDLSRLGEGRPTVAWVVSKFVVLQLARINGELTSALSE